MVYRLLTSVALVLVMDWAEAGAAGLEGVELAAAESELVVVDTVPVVVDTVPVVVDTCLLYTSPSPRDATLSRMPSSA